MFYKNVLVITDNTYIFDTFEEIILKYDLSTSINFSYACSKVSFSNFENRSSGTKFSIINVKKQVDYILQNFDLVISAHCKQIFPKELVNGVKCINIHPGYNPYNRGWYPQVFSILNNTILGATIHEIDEYLDHGGIIAQKEVIVTAFDTSLSAYQKVMEAEKELLDQHIMVIIQNKYCTTTPDIEGNINLKADFEKLCHIDLDEYMTMQQALDKLRALTHGNFRNAYFIDNKTGKKVFVNITLTSEN